VPSSRPPGEEEGVRAAGQLALQADRESGNEFHLDDFCRQAADLRAITPELEAHAYTKKHNMTLGSPRHAKRSQGYPKETQGYPNENKWDPEETNEAHREPN